MRLASRFHTWLNNIPIKDPVNRRMAALLQVMLIGLIVMIVLATTVNLFLLTPDISISEILTPNLLVLTIFGSTVTLLRRGHFRISVMILITIFIVLVFASILNSNLRSAAESLSFFTLAILLAGLLVGRPALFITFTISASMVLFFALNEHDPALRLDYIAVAGNFILLNGLMTVFINSFGITLRNALNASLQREQELKVEIANRKRAEEKATALNEQLQNQVAELERFTYTVSHDLRNPLVTIKGFLGMLEKDLRENRKDRIQTDFERIAGAAEKMDALLADLLELSRIGRIINPPMEIDTARLIGDAIDNLDGRLRPKNIRVQVAPELPSLYGDRTRLREVFENLIENAAKYIGTQPAPLIEIGTRQDKSGATIFIKDNGIGIEERYQTRIFALFEKLNPNSEGSGIGLALVKRIIETHKGKIWVESEGLGKGSTFCFTIPARQEI